MYSLLRVSNNPAILFKGGRMAEKYYRFTVRKNQKWRKKVMARNFIEALQIANKKYKNWTDVYATDPEAYQEENECTI